MSRTSLLSMACILSLAAGGPMVVGASPGQQAASTRAAPVLVVVSANAEWKIVREREPGVSMRPSPWGEYCETSLDVNGVRRPVVFFHGGWGKVAAAGSLQYAIDRWRPGTVINIGTCGGFKGHIGRHEVILANRTVIYDIKEAMGDSVEAIRDYTVAIDLSWLKTEPTPVRRTLLVSADRDLVPQEVGHLRAAYGAVAGDWESGAIAYVCDRNRVRLLILRGVSDLVDEHGTGEAYGNLAAFEEGTRVVMGRLLDALPRWLAVVPN